MLALAGHPVEEQEGPVWLMIWWSGQPKATQLGVGGAGIPICASLAME